MPEYMRSVPGIETLSDSIEKFGPALLAAGMVSAGGQVASEATEAARDKVTQASEELETSQEADEVAAQQANTEEGQNPGIRGMDSLESTSGEEEQDGKVDVPTDDGLPPETITRTWFIDNFGMTGSEIAGLLIKSKEYETLDALTPLLVKEKQAILSAFTGVSPSLVSDLPLTDRDYDSLNTYTKRLAIPFRRFVKMWEGAEDSESRHEAYDMWKSIIDASERLSPRERSILVECSSQLLLRGALNAQTLKNNGVPASAAEISSLIKSHGFLYDIISVGEVSKSIGRGLFYDVKRRDVILKDAGRFLAGLIENTKTKFEFDNRMRPRISVGFSAPTAPWYADALNNELGGDCTKAQGSRLVIEGETYVLKALSLATPHIVESTHDAFMLNKALNGDEDALIVMIHDSLDRNKQVSFLKSKRISIDQFDLMKEQVTSYGG